MVERKRKLKPRLRVLGAWLFSWFLYLIAGYGYKPSRSFLADARSSDFVAFEGETMQLTVVPVIDLSLPIEETHLVALIR